MPKITRHGGPTDSAAGVSFPVGVLPEETAPSPPPLSGKGSGRQAWADYAAGLGVDVGNDSKPKIIAKVG